MTAKLFWFVDGAVAVCYVEGAGVFAKSGVGSVAVSGAAESDGRGSVQVVLGVALGGLIMTAFYLLVGRLRRSEPDGRAAVAVLRERRRIAQELHDVVGHGLLVVAMWARQIADLDREARPMAEAIDRTAQQTLNEMRQAIGMLRGAAAMDEIDRWMLSTRVADLIARMPPAVLPVAFELSGLEVELNTTVRTTALRVVQEGLTNALKHDSGRPVRVALQFGDELEVSVVTGTSKGAVRPAAPPDTDGRYGLSGLRERVAAHCGTFECGALGDGGFLVRASIPLSGGHELP